MSFGGRLLLVIGDQYYKNINNLAARWDGIHKLTNHGLAICVDTEKVNIVRNMWHISSNMCFRNSASAYGNRE